MPNVGRDILAEAKRVRLLNELKLLDADNTPVFDRLTNITAHIMNVPSSFATIVTQDFQYCIGFTGLVEPYATTRRVPLSHSFCQHVVATKSPLVINDTRKHPTGIDNLAIEDLDVLAYLGIPLVTTDGVVLGSFCIIDDKPRTWTDDEIYIMQEMSVNVMNAIELRSELQKREETEKLLTASMRQREQLRIIKEMTQAISHDLRTPLSSIQIKVDLLAREIPNERSIDRITDIRSKLLEVRDILNSFTDLWSIDENFTDATDSVDIHQIMEGAINQLQLDEQFEDIKGTIDKDYTAQYHTIKANPYMLNVMLNNIIENAIIFRKDDSFQVEIRTENVDNKLRIHIKDEGIGIAEADIPFIFDATYKVDKARTQKHGGGGLGLTIANQIVSEYQGTIKVQSVLGEGSEFIISLPLSESPSI